MFNYFNELYSLGLEDSNLNAHLEYHPAWGCANQPSQFAQESGFEPRLNQYPFLSNRSSLARQIELSPVCEQMYKRFLLFLSLRQFYRFQSYYLVIPVYTFPYVIPTIDGCGSLISCSIFVHRFMLDVRLNHIY